jgi:TP901 family phage tail tape measure protein
MADSFITLGTRLDSASLQATLRQINGAITRVERRGVNVSVDSGKFTRPLGKITGATNEFTRSLEASNARVLAFGASAGAIFQVQRAFEFLLKSTIEVEKRLQDVNVILAQTDRGLAKFGNSLFAIAQKTAQSFDTVAEAATELARQGLSTEETLQRTSDALILTRLSGMDAAASVSSLTAALNTFNREALSSTQVINKLANVDAAFAVSTDDLAQSMRRVGSTAQDVGVSFDQLLAITASVQQTTARGGPVIGNALKSIFTRIQRKDTLNLLEELGVKVRDLEGQMMPAMNVLGNLAKKFPTLSKAQQAHTAEVTAGVFQMNNLRAILADLGQEYSIYDKAVKVSTGSTNEAILRNELLNKTLDAQVKKTMALATQAAKKIGDLTLRPVTERVVGIMQKVLGDINEKDTSDIGGKIAQGMMSGIGNFLQGPGLLLITGFLGKLGMNLAKFVKESGAQFMGLNTAAVQQKSLQEGIARILEAQPGLIKQAASSTQGRVNAEREVVGILEQETLMMQNMEKVASRMAGMMVRGGVTVSGGGQVQAPTHMRPRGAAQGHIPNFNKRQSAVSEIISAAEGGYRAGAIKQMKMPGLGTMTYNSREQVKHVAGFAQPFINPPQHSKAGRKHKEKAMAKTGVDPYAVPNFANPAYLNLYGRGKMGLGTVSLPGKGAAASLENFGVGRFYKSGPKVPKGQKNILRTAYDHALAGHGVSGVKGKIALGEIGEVAVARATMPTDVAKRFYNDLLSPAVSGAIGRRSFTDALGGKDNASRIAQDIVYHPSGTARSFIGSRERAMDLLASNPSAKGSFFAKAEITHSTLLEKALMERGGGHQFMPFSKVKMGQGETILDAVSIKGGKIIGPAEFKPSFHAGMPGRDARGSLSYKSLFSSDSGKEGGLLHFLRSGMEKNIARGGYKDKSGQFHSPEKLKGDITKLDNYVDTAKTADFQRMQKVSQGEISLEGAKSATAVKDIFGKDVMKLLQGTPSASNYDKLMMHFGAAQGFIPNFPRGGPIMGGRGKGNIFDFDGTLGVPPKGMVTTPTGKRKMREGDTWHGWSVGHMEPTKLANAASKNKEPITVLTARGQDSVPYIQSWLKAQKIPYSEVIATGSRKYPKGIEKTHQKKAYEIFERPHLQNAKFYEDSRANAYYAALRGASKDMNIQPRIVDFGSRWGQVNPAGQGFLPNFSKGSPLADAFRREKKASGLPESQLYAASVDTPEYKGLAVGNKRDERTKGDLVRAVKSHPNPAKAGMKASGGYIPNYAADSVDYMAMTSGMMMAGMMMNMGGSSAEEKSMLRDQKAGFEKEKDIQRKAKAAAKNQEKEQKNQEREKTRLQKEVKTADRDVQKATKSRMEAKFGTRTTPGGERTGGIKQAEAAQQKAADRVVRREVNRAIMHGGTPRTLRGGAPIPTGATPARIAGLGMTGLRAERGTVGGVPGINPSTGRPHTGSYNAKIEALRGVGHARAQQIISQSVDTSGRTPRGSVGEHSGDKAAKDLTKKTLLLQKAREAEARATDRVNAAQSKKAAAQAKIWAQDKEIAKTSRKVANAKNAEAKAAGKVAALKPDTKGAVSKWVKGKGFGLGIGIQMMAGVAEQFVGGKGETPEERAEKAKVRGVGTAAGMAGTGAMIGGPWGAAIGLAIGSGLALMDHQKASKKTAEDYAKAIQKETESRKKALLGAEAYIKMQGRLTGMFNRGAGPAETGMMRRQMREQLMEIENPELRRELIGAAGDESKMREAMAKVQETISMEEKKASVGILSAKAGEGGAAQKGVMKDLAKTLSAAFELKGIKSWELMGKSGADLTAKLEEMGVGAKEAADMIEALGEENQGLVPQILAQARGYEELEAETSKSVESIERMALATADLNYRLSQISNSFEHLMNVSKSLFNHSQKVSKELTSAVTGDETIGKERRERFGVSANILKNIETNTLKNTLLQKRFHDAVLKLTMEKSSEGGSLPPGLMDLQVLARKRITGPADLAAGEYREIIDSDNLGRAQSKKLENALAKAEFEIKENNLNLAQSNRLLIIQNQLAESNRSFQRRRTLQQSLTAGGALGGGGIIEALKKLTTVAGLPTRGESSKAAMMQMQGLRDLEKMGFDFANGIGKAMKENLLERSFRAEAPDALEALGMSPDNVSKIINSNFNPDISKNIIESMNSAQGGMMAQVIDSANLSKIASEERAYKAKLLEAEFKNRNMLVESLGANVDVTALLIGSNYDLIVSNEKLGTEGADNYRAAIDIAMTGAVARMSEVMSDANTGFMQAVESFKGEQSLQHARINQEKAFASLEGKTAGAEDMMGSLSKGTKFSMVPPAHKDIFDEGGFWSKLHKTNAFVLGKLDSTFGSILPGKTMTYANLTEMMDIKTVSQGEVDSSSFDKNMIRFMSRVQTGENAEDVAKMTAAFDAYKSTLTDDVPADNQTKISLVRVQEALLRSFAKISQVTEEQGLIQRTELPGGRSRVEGSIPLDLADWPKIDKFMGAGAEAKPAEAIDILKRDLNDMVFEGESGVWQPNMIAALSKLTDVVALLPGKKGFEAYELRNDPAKLLTALLAIQTAVIGVHPNQQGQIYAEGRRQVLPASTGKRTDDPSFPQTPFAAPGYGNIVQSNEIPVIRTQQQLGVKELDDMMSGIDDMMGDFRSTGKFLFHNFQETFREGRTVKPEEAKLVQKSVDAFKSNEVRVRKILEGVALRAGDDKGFSERAGDIKDILAQFETITNAFKSHLQGIIKPDKGVQVSKQLAADIAKLLGGQIESLKPTPSTTRQRGTKDPKPEAVAKAWTNAFTELAKKSDELSIKISRGGEEGALSKLSDALTDFSSESSSGMEILNATIEKLKGTEFAISADPLETPLLAIQQSVNSLSKLNSSENESTKNALNNKEDIVISVLSNILEAILSDENVSKSQREEIKNALHLLPEQYKRKMDEIEGRSGTRALRDKLIDLRQRASSAPIPPPLIPGSMLAGQVSRGTQQTSRPLTTMARQTFGKYGRSFLGGKGEVPRSGLPSVNSLLGIETNFEKIPDPSEIDKMMRDVQKASPDIKDPAKKASMDYLTMLAKGTKTIHNIAQQVAKQLEGDNTLMIEEIHKLAPVLGDMGFQKLEKGLQAANKDMSSVVRDETTASQKAAGLATAVGKHTMEMANIFINQNLLAAFRGPKQIPTAKEVEKQWMDTIKDALPAIGGDMSADPMWGDHDPMSPQGAFPGGLFGNRKLTPKAEKRRQAHEAARLAGSTEPMHTMLFRPGPDDYERSLIMDRSAPGSGLFPSQSRPRDKRQAMEDFLVKLKAGEAEQELVDDLATPDPRPWLQFQKQKEHTILGGETAAGIAQKHGISLQRLMEGNIPGEGGRGDPARPRRVGIRDPNQINAGDILNIPATFKVEHQRGGKLTANQQKKIAEQLEKQFKQGIVYNNEVDKATAARKKITDNAKEIAAIEEKIKNRTIEAAKAQDKLKALHSQRAMIESKLSEVQKKLLLQPVKIGDRNIRARHQAVVLRAAIEQRAIKERTDQSAMLQKTIDVHGGAAILPSEITDPRAKAAADQIAVNQAANEQGQQFVASLQAEKDALLRANAALEKFSKAIGISSKDLQDMSPFELDLELIRQEGLPRENLLQQMRSPRTPQPGGKFAAQTFSAISPSRVGETQQRNLKREMEKILTIEKEAAAGGRKAALAESKVAEADVLLAGMARSPKSKEFRESSSALGVAAKDKKTAEDNVIALLNKKAAILKKDGHTQEELDEVNGKLGDANEKSVSARRNEKNQLDAHNATYADYINIINAGKDAQSELNKAKQSHTDALDSQKVIIDNWGSVTQAAIEIQKRFVTAEHVKRMEALDTQIASTTMSLSMMDDPKKFKELLNSTKKLTEVQLRLAAKQARLEEAAGIGTGADTYQREQDVTRQQLRTGKIGVWEAFGADTFEKGETMSRGWKERVLDDMIEIREGMISSFSDGWAAFALEGKSASDVAKQWGKDFLRMINQAFYNATIGRFMGNLMSGGFGSYGRPSLPKQQSGGELRGPSHSKGGIKLEAEGGEFIVRKSEVRKPGVLGHLREINEGRVFQEGGPVGINRNIWRHPTTWPDQQPVMPGWGGGRQLGGKFQGQQNWGGQKVLPNAGGNPGGEHGIFANDFAPPAFHHRQSELEMMDRFNRRAGVAGNPFNLQKGKGAAFAKNRMDNMMQAIAGGGYLDNEHTLLGLGHRIGPNGPILPLPARLNEKEHAAREQLQFFQEQNPLAFNHLNQWWRKNKSGWTNPQVYKEGGTVGNAGGTAYPWSDSPARKFDDKLPFWDRVDPRRRGFSRVGGSSGNNAFGPTAVEWGGARKDQWQEDPVRQQMLADFMAKQDREHNIQGMRDAGFGPFGMPLGGDPWPGPRWQKQGNMVGGKLPEHPVDKAIREEIEKLWREAEDDRAVPQFGAGGVVTARDTFRAKVPKLDKDYIKKLANSPHILNWMKDPNNIERFGFTGNETFESAYMKMVRHAEKIKLKPGKRMSQALSGAGRPKWENGMQPGVANDMMAAGWIEPEAFGVLNEWFSINNMGHDGFWGNDMTNFPGAAGETGGGVNAFFTDESERKDQQRALNRNLTSMGLMSPNPKPGQIKSLKVDGFGGASTTAALALFRNKKGIPAPTAANHWNDAKTREALGMVVGASGISKAGWKGKAPSGFLDRRHFKSRNRAEMDVHPYTGMGGLPGWDPAARWELDPKSEFFTDKEGFPSRYEIIPGKGLGHVVKVGEGLTSIGLQYREEMTTDGSIAKGANGVTISAALAAANPELMKTLKTRAGGKPDISKFLKPNDVVLIPGGGQLFNPEADKKRGTLDGKPFPGFRQGWWEQFNKMSTMHGTVQPVEYGAGGVVWDPKRGGSVPNQFRRQSALEIPATGTAPNQTLLPKHQAWNNRLKDFWKETFRASNGNRELATANYYAGIQGHMAAPRVRATRGARGVSPGGYRYTQGPIASTLAGANIDGGGVAGIGPPTRKHRNAMRNRGSYFQREETPDFAAWGVHPSAVDKDVARVIFSEVGPQHPDLVHVVGDAMRNRYDNQESRTRHGISTGYGISVGGSRYPAKFENGAWRVQAPTKKGFKWRAAQPGEATTASAISMKDIAWQGAPGGFKPGKNQAQQFSAIGDKDNDNWHLSGRLSVFQQSPQGFNDMNTWLSGGDAARAVTERYRTHYGSDVLGDATNGWVGERENIQNVWKKSLEQSATDKRVAKNVTVPGQRQSGLLDPDEEWYKSWQIPMSKEFNKGMKPTAMTQNIGPFWMWRPDYKEGWQSRANDPQHRGRVAPERRQRGGLITAGSGTTDDVPVYLKKGEMVMTQKAVQDNGVQYFKDIEAGRVRMEEGGEVDEELIRQANEATEENQESEGEETGERNPPSLNEKYGDNLAEAWHGAPGEFEMQGIATQDKKWYNSGNMPGEGMTRVAEVVEERFGKGFKYGGTNTFAYNDPDKPSLGRFFVDNKMSMYAMGDKDNPQNEMVEKRRKMFVDYKGYLKDEYKNRKQQFDAFKKKKKQMLKSAWIQFAVAMVQVGVAAKSKSANKKYGTDQQVADNPEQFTSMPKGMDADMAGSYVDPIAQENWANKMKWADSPGGSSLIAGGTTAAIGWGMGMEGKDIALTAGTAMATAAITSYAKIKGMGRQEQNALNSNDPAIQQAALDRWKKHLRPEEIAGAEQSIAFHGTETQLKQWVKEENKAMAGVDKWAAAMQNEAIGAGPGTAAHALAEKTMRNHQIKLQHVQAGKKAFLAESQALHPGLLERDAENVWGMNAKERANLKTIKLGWARSKEAATVRRNQLEGMNENADMLGRMLQPGGNMGGFPVPKKAQGGLITGADGPPGEDTVKALLTRGEFVLSQEAVNKFPGGSNALLRYNEIAKHGGQVARFAEGGMVGRESQFAPTSPVSAATGGALGLNVGQGTEGMTDSLMQLVDIVQSIRDTVDKEKDEKQREKRAGEQNGTQDSAGGVNQEITNNVAVTVNVNSDGTAEATASSSSEGGGEGASEDGEGDADKHEKFAELMQGVVLQTIVEEQRPGGLLYRK